MRYAPMVFALALLPLAAAAEIYRWVDGKGQVHFSQTPPRAGEFKGEYTTLGPKKHNDEDGETPGDDSAPGSDAAKDVADYKAKQDAAAKKAAEEAQAAADRQDRCDAARMNLEIMGKRGYNTTISQKNEKGESVPLNDEDFQKRMQSEQEIVKKNCG